jgi:TatD DNase family protein
MKNNFFVDTHAHINCLIKEPFDRILTQEEVEKSELFITEAIQNSVKLLINVGTSLVESQNCVAIAERFSSCYATVGIHPNDCTEFWLDDFKKIEELVKKKESTSAVAPSGLWRDSHAEVLTKAGKIVGIGECGIDRHYPDYNLNRQYDAFRAQIELALRHDLGLVIHSRDAYDETLKILEEYKTDLTRAVMHCFSYDAAFAHYCFNRGIYLGIGGTITYPKNNLLREIVTTMPLDNLVLETDAPFLPPQSLRGQKNHPKNILLIAQYIAELRKLPLEELAHRTTQNALKLFGLDKKQLKI